MAAPETLHGTELIDCARANGSYGIEVAAERCGYGNDIERFQQELKQACDRIGVTFESFGDILKSSTKDDQVIGEIVAPDTPNQL